MRGFFPLLLLYEYILPVCYGFYPQECGIRYEVNRHKPVISHGFEAEYLEFPWHVALYRQYSPAQEPEYICGGSIIHRDIIVTAAHCVYNERILSIEKAAFLVAAGKHNRAWSQRDPAEQRLKVTEIRVPTTYLGLPNRYADDIAIIALNDSIEFSSVVMPVCVDWNSELNVNQTTVPGTIVGWGYNENGTLSDKVMMAKLNYFNFTSCRENVEDSGFSSFVTSDKFCAGVDNGTAVEKGDSGGGFVVPRNSSGNIERYYLYGIVSTKDTWTNQTAAFTDLNIHLRWLNLTIVSILNSGSCMPFSFDSNVELTQCKNHGLSISCNEPAKPGTKGKVLCRSSFHDGLPYRLHTGTKCNKNRTWSPIQDSCIECGKRYSYRDNKSLRTDESKSFSEFPWHIGIYIEEDEKKTISYICGGSIVHPNAVLTAAQCVRDSKNKTTKYYIGAGKRNKRWDILEKNEQKFLVTKIFKKATLKGKVRKSWDDIAILKLNETVKLSEYVMPACIDWSTQLELHKNPYVTGLCVGWGHYQSSGESLDILRVLKLQYFDWNRCFDKTVSITHNPLIFTKDTICATRDEGFAALEASFHGGALTFPRYDPKTQKQTYYLYGVLSYKLNDHIFRFTDVMYHVKWIKKIIAYNITQEVKTVT